MEQYMVYIWLGVFILTFVIEAFTFDLVAVWFAAAAFITMFLALIPGFPYYGQIIVFLVLSILLFLMLRPLASKALSRKVTKSNIDEIIGQRGVVVKQIEALKHGEVSIHDVIWNALPADNKSTISLNEIVEVVAIQGNKLFVKIVEQQ